MQFYLGVHHVRWLQTAGVPLFISAPHLRRRKSALRAIAPWALDSGGFSELSLKGRWTVGPEQYAEEASTWHDRVGLLRWCAVQDWMCEPMVREKTGLSVREHQKRTVQSYLDLARLAPSIPWVPVLQGWEYEDYMQHIEDYASAGVVLSSLPLVGVGSVCRRQHTAMAEDLVRQLFALGIKCHLFGFKIQGLRRAAAYAASSDSMAWSFAARRSPATPGCTHRNCANCLKYALPWRERVLKVIAGSLENRQPWLWEVA